MSLLAWPRLCGHSSTGTLPSVRRFRIGANMELLTTSLNDLMTIQAPDSDDSDGEDGDEDEDEEDNE